MFCSQCGTQLGSNAKFCSKCGVPIGAEPAPVVEVSSTKPLKAAPEQVRDPSTLSTKWLTYWNYFSLPVGGLLGLLISLGMPALGIMMVPLAILQFAVAYGLHYRKLWAWQWNWGLVVVAYIFSLAPTPTPGSHGGPADVAGQVFIKLILGSLIWMWPNYVYWRKRKGLFS